MLGEAREELVERCMENFGSSLLRLRWARRKAAMLVCMAGRDAPGTFEAVARVMISDLNAWILWTMNDALGLMFSP